MALFRLEDRYPDYRDRFAKDDGILGASVYVRTDDGDDKVGSIDTVLVDEAGRFRYLVVDTGFWILGKRVLLPMGRCIDDPDSDRVYASGLSKAQVKNLPEYSDDLVVDYDYEEQVRTVYRTPVDGDTVPLETPVAVEQPSVKTYTPSRAVTHPSPGPRVSDSADYDLDPDLYAMDDANHQRLRLYEERLVADKQRLKTGEVTVTKRIETEYAEASVPIQKEKIVIEIESIPGTTRVNTPTGGLQAGETTHLDVYEERADIHKQPVVRQEVTIRKEVEEEVVSARDTVRREELDIHEEGNPDVSDHRR